MTWRLHLSNQAIQRIHILSGKPSLVAAWFQRNRVFYYDLDTGAPMGERTIKDVQVESRQDEKWQEYITSLVAPNNAYLPMIRAAQAVIYLSDDGRMRLYHTRDSELFLEIEGREIKLESGKSAELIAVSMDRFLGLIAALDASGRLYIYQQQIPVGVIETGLQLDDAVQPSIAISHGGGSIFLSDGQQILLLDSGGQIRKRLETHYTVGKLDCSPNGRLLVTGDMETNVIRVYNGADLTPTHQRHAVDVLAEAAQLQLIADPPPINVALNTLTINNKGVLAFGLAGVICTGEMEQMDALPRLQKLL